MNAPATTPELTDRARGALIGLAVGDALGAQVAGADPGSFTAVTQMTGGGRYELPPGAFAASTAMTLCLAESLVACRGMNTVDQLERYVRWYREGHMTSTDVCVGISSTTRRSLEAFERNPEDPYPGLRFPKAAGNGPLARVAPVAIVFSADPKQMLVAAVQIAQTTHGAVFPADASRFLTGLIAGALSGLAVHELLAGVYSPSPGAWERQPFVAPIRWVVEGSYRETPAAEIYAGGKAWNALEAALWALSTTTSFQDAVLAAVNLGEYADVVGATVGQVAGAIYGLSGIPDEWQQTLKHADTISLYADSLLRLRGRVASDVSGPAAARPSVTPPPDPEIDVVRRAAPGSGLRAQTPAPPAPEPVPPVTLPKVAEQPATEIGPGVPVLLWATSKSKGGEFWQRGMCAVTSSVTPDDGSDPVVWVAWLIEYEHARSQRRAPRAQPWPAHLLVVDPKPPRRDQFAVPDQPPLPPRELRRRDED